MVSTVFKCAASLGVVIIVMIGIVVGLVFGISGMVNKQAQRSFTIDYERNKFKMDGKDFQYVSGSFHYFRALPSVWQDRLRMMRAAGLNVVDTYVEWATHNPEENLYDFDNGMANLELFLTLAETEGLYVILRPGPYICAERDNGGIPYWLFTKYPNIKLRTSDPNYLREVEIWYQKLMPRMERFFYENGGPIIMVQVENEYGVSKICDRDYLNWLKEETAKYVNNKALLFTVDIPNSAEEMRCGQIDGVFATTDFGIDRANEIDEIWAMLREIQPNGPLVNSEFYPGWLTHWQELNQRRDADAVADTLRMMLEAGASVNFYMFFGGTNFGFTAGANDWGIGKYMADITSYDYDAIMDEAGDPNAMKFVKVRNVISEFFPLPPLEVPDKAEKMVLPDVSLSPVGSLLSESGRTLLSRKQNGKDYDHISSDKPLSFEKLKQFSGLVLYETYLPEFEIDPTLLTINDLRDRALIFVDEIYVGSLSRENAIDSLPINAGLGNKLSIFVENQGRINFNVFDDMKGILGSVTIQKFNGTLHELTKWTMMGYSLTEYDDINDFILNTDTNEPVQYDKRGMLVGGPSVFSATFDIELDVISDTYLDPTGWGKGIVFVNGFNLGRYWPLVGPQITLYVPKDLLLKRNNVIVMVEYQKIPLNKVVKFTATPRLDGN